MLAYNASVKAQIHSALRVNKDLRRPRQEDFLQRLMDAINSAEEQPRDHATFYRWVSNARAGAKYDSPLSNGNDTSVVSTRLRDAERSARESQ